MEHLQSHAVGVWMNLLHRLCRMRHTKRLTVQAEELSSGLASAWPWGITVVERRALDVDSEGRVALTTPPEAHCTTLYDRLHI